MPFLHLANIVLQNRPSIGLHVASATFLLPQVCLGASRDAARLQEEWFTDMDAVRDKAGLMERIQPASSSGKASNQPACAMSWLAAKVSVHAVTVTCGISFWHHTSF